MAGATVVALVAAFLLALMDKWGILEWLQVHAPNEFLYKLFSCRFCCSFWMGLLVSVVLAIVMGQWYLLFCPIYSTILTRDLL